MAAWDSGGRMDKERLQSGPRCAMFTILRSGRHSVGAKLGLSVAPITFPNIPFIQSDDYHPHANFAKRLAHDDAITNYYLNRNVAHGANFEQDPSIHIAHVHLELPTLVSVMRHGKSS